MPSTVKSQSEIESPINPPDNTSRQKKGKSTMQKALIVYRRLRYNLFNIGPIKT
jgi:hypothetical protein